MEKGSPFIPGERPAETEPQTPELTDESLETTSEIAVDEEYLTVDAIDRHSQESVERKLAQEEPFELIHGRKTEVMDEPTSSPAATPISSIVSSLAKSKPVLDKVSRSPIDKNMNRTNLTNNHQGVGVVVASIVDSMKLYRRSIFAGFFMALIIIAIYILIYILFL